MNNTNQYRLFLGCPSSCALIPEQRDTQINAWGAYNPIMDQCLIWTVPTNYKHKKWSNTDWKQIYSILWSIFSNQASIQQSARLVKDKFMGVGRQKIWGGPTENYGYEKYYYFWVHKQCAKHTPSRGKGGLGAYPHRKFLKISAIRLNLEATLANNFMLLSIL